MPRSKMDSAAGHQLSAELFLRSINLRYDAEEPDRIAHFHPTTKSVSLLKALLAQDDDRAFFVVAPYGTGKSLTVTYLLHYVENRPASADALKIIEERLSGVSRELGRQAAQRRRKRTRGLALALYGRCPSLPEGIKAAAIEGLRRQRLGRQAGAIARMSCETMDRAAKLLLAVKEKCVAAGFDRIALLWDEFGRHVESLIADGRHTALIDIQLLAELVARSSDFPMTMGLVLHQGLLQHAGQMSQSVRAEWTKIEGRFRTIQYVDDSKEVYRLIAEVVEANRPELALPPKSRISAAAAACKELGLFADFKKTELTDLLLSAYPLEPVALYLLPRVSGRVAQNERTLFTFLYGADMSQPVGSQALFDYFSPAMRADTAVGGTHRQWLETQSAISKASDNIQAVDVLKTACLLGLGTSGERSRAGRGLLLFALQGFERGPLWQTVVDRLVDRKLLLYRRHNDEISVWHGTDADLRGRLEEEKRRRVEGFELVQFLAHEARPPVWKPLEYNSDFGVCRYWSGEYLTADELEAYLCGTVLGQITAGVDGKMLYLIAESPAQLRKAEGLAHEELIHPQVVVAIPKEPLPLLGAALEVHCLTRMQFNADLVGSDPLVLPEIQQMADDSRVHLQRLIDQLLRPSPTGPRWFYRGRERRVASASGLRRMLSEITGAVFDKTPKIYNEMIVRKKPSGTIVNSRKKLVMGILERSGKDHLGIKGNFPDASMFRTVLLHTGLYRKNDDGHWGYAAPHAISTDLGLRAAWERLRQFFAEPADRPKKPRDLLEELQSPPYGVRAGLLPILFAAALKAFSRVVSLTQGGEYVSDILPSVIEDLCKHPESFALTVLDLDDTTEKYLRGLYECFSAVDTHRVSANDLVRMCYDAVEGWKFHLPAAALTTRQIAEHAREFQLLMGRKRDPVRLLLTDIPRVCARPIRQYKKLLQAVARCKRELESVAGTYVERAGASLRKAVAHAKAHTNRSIREVSGRWAACFPDSFVQQHATNVGKSLLSRMRMPYDDDALLIESLSHLLVGESVSRWDDSTVIDFDRKIREAVHHIEEAALSADLDFSGDDPARDGLARLLQARMTDLYQRTAALLGPEEAERMLASIVLANKLGEKQHGDHARSS